MDNRAVSHKSNKDKGGRLVPVLCRIAGIFLIVSVLAFGGALVIPQGLGYGVYNIMSGSMEPEIPVGSIIYVRPVEPSTIEEGEIVVYNRRISDDEIDPTEFVVAHRVVRVSQMQSEFRTKGDANETEDINPVKFSEVLGVVRYHFPFLGQFMAIYTTLPGKICLIGVALCGVLLNVLAGRLTDRRREEDEG